MASLLFKNANDYPVVYIDKDVIIFGDIRATYAFP